MKRLFFLLCLLPIFSFAQVTQTRAPTRDDGTAAGTWTGSAGSRFTLVDDYPDASGTDVLTHGTTAGNIVFGFTAFSIPTGATITSVAVRYYDSKTASQAASIAARIRVNSTNYDAASHNPANGTLTQRTDTWVTNPNTGVAWTVADVNGTGAAPLQLFGWISSDASPTINLTSIEIVVTYTERRALSKKSF